MVRQEGQARISSSSCEAEIKAVDEGTKGTQYVRCLEEELVIADPSIPTPLYNDNNGAVDWSQTGKVSKKLRHVNIRELRVRQARKAGKLARPAKSILPSSLVSRIPLTFSLKSTRALTTTALLATTTSKPGWGVLEVKSEASTFFIPTCS